MLRLHLPPNFAAAVVRNAVPLRVEVDLGTPPSDELIPVLALLQRWCGTPTPPKFIQLSRAQLRELADAAGTLAIFVENGAATWWRHDDLLGEAELAPGAKEPGSVAKGQQTGAARPAVRRKAEQDLGAPLTVDGSEHFLAITLPSRESAIYDSALALLKENGFTLETSNRKWWLRDRHKSLNFLAAHLAELRGRYGAEFTPNFEKNTARVRDAEITTDVDSASGGFSVGIGIRAGDTDPAALRSALASSRGYVETGGSVYLLDTIKLEKLAQAQRALAGDPNAAVAPQRMVTVPAARAAEVQEILEQLSPNFQPPEAWKVRSAALRNLTALEPAPVADSLDALMRPYQRLGTAWLWHLCRHDLGGVLADEMGLGKTLQALALLAAATNANAQPSTLRLQRSASPNPRPSPLNRIRPFLVICPASLLENWRREAVRFTAELQVFVHHGDRRLTRAADCDGYDLIITSYGTLTRDQELFAACEFACVIADEAQHIKNRRSQNAAALRALHARSRFVLTGTPVENSLEDLRSLFDFLLPGYLTKVPPGLRGEERAWFDQRLRAQTAPYILRRTKNSVAPELPEKIEQVVWCDLAPAQAALYRETQQRGERELFDLEASGASEAKVKFTALTQLLRLRQICCDPRLVAATGERLTGGGRGPEGELAVPDSAFAVQPATSSPVPAGVDSAKLDAFRELLDEAIDDGHRVLVFSQFTSLLALLRVELNTREIAHCYLDGSMPARARQAEVDRFQQQKDVPLFLLSLKAGGTGLNLTGADTVVIYDPWWNPAAEAQATDRAHRIGQTRTVSTYKLIAAGTVEEKVLGLQAEKRTLLANVFEASEAVTGGLALAEIKALLR